MILCALYLRKLQMKIIILFYLLSLTKGQLFPNEFYQLFQEPVAKNNIQSGTVASWKNTEKNVARDIFNNVASSLTPLALDIVFTSNISTRCTGSLMSYFTGLYQMKYWAIKMLDSSGVLPIGSTGGKLSSVGDYDTCIGIEELSFKGKYCMFDFKLPLLEKEIFQPTGQGVLKLDNTDAEDMFEAAKKFGLLESLQPQIAFCMPSVCTQDELEKIAKKVVDYTKLGIEVSLTFCEEKNDYVPFTAGEIMIILLLACLFFLVIVGTVVEVFLLFKPFMSETKYQGTLLKFILCFSSYSNMKKIFEDDTDPRTISAFHGIRVLTMLWVSLFHTYNFDVLRIYDGLFYGMQIPKQFIAQPGINAFLGVDSFFFLSGVLLAYTCLNRKTSILSQIMKRYYRLTPTLTLVMICICILNHFGSGPFWREVITNNVSRACKVNGWLVMSYLTNNITQKGDMCMKWTWYLSADFQLCVIGLYVLSLLRKNPGKGLTAIGLLYFTGLFSSVCSYIYYKIPPVLILPQSPDKTWNQFSTYAHIPTHLHLPVFSIGMCVGFILATKRVTISKRANLMGWTITLATVICLTFGTYHWNQGNRASLFVSTLYGSTHRSIWALCLAFITVSCHTGQGGIINTFLSWKGFVPLSRLTYIGYLINFPIIYIYEGTSRKTITYSHQSLLVIYFGLMVITFFFAFVLTLVFELPFGALQTLLTKKSQQKKTVQTANGVDTKWKHNI